jgi:hypothetical protein
MRLSDSQLEALRNLSRKKAGADVGWIAIAEARDLTDLGLAVRKPSGWEITAAGAARLDQEHPARDAADTVVEFRPTPH